MKAGFLVCSALTLALAAGCASTVPEPNIASSAPEPSYAASFPAKLQRTLKGLDEDEANLRALQGRFDYYPNDLTNPPWDVVLLIAKRANDAGHSQAYVEQRRAFAASRAFFEEEGPELLKKVAGTAQYVVKEKGCNVDVTGPISHALKEGVEKQSEKKLRAANEGHQLIDEYRDTLGKKNVPALEKQADELAEASYLADISLVERKLAVRRMLAEVEQIKKTIPEAQAQERAFQSGAGRTDAEKQASHQRMEALNRAQAEVDAAVAAAQKLNEALEKRIENAQKAHQEQVQKLLNVLQSKAPAK